MVTQWFIICAIIGLVIFLPLVWTRIERRLDQTLLKGASSFVRMSILAVVIIILEGILVGLIVSISKWNVVDTFFVSSMLLLCFVWLTPLFNQQRKNRQNANDRLHSGGGIDMRIEAFHMRFTPFVIGSTGFAIVSLLATVLYYR
ncbi:hypothetical protein [Priestia taiwanensis]|uniref:DUF4149 domain-containing protein n=1 Tax=Priestia taiwanensis TaxID=1347902 RepID=A0A917AY43_9BACI|nr:hypothetical protein [Priestia taiwanensis]MBM7364815.1 hypothetical protein [Priestia taiwanensis]GGE79906.1 hypothetical protein GCM10007140_31800 [Priestia taiwanensis]